MKVSLNKKIIMKYKIIQIKEIKFVRILLYLFLKFYKTNNSTMIIN